MDFRRIPALDPLYVCAVVGWSALHVGALGIAWGTRVAAGSRLEVPLQWMCFLTMAAIGAAAWICRQLEMGLWIPSGVTLVAMVLTAVLDFRRTHEIHATLHPVANR
jgi:hypothetical protein